MDTVLEPRVHHFTTITIPAGVRVTTMGSGVLELRATGSVIIDGVIDVSGGDGGPGTNRGPGATYGGGGHGGPSARPENQLTNPTGCGDAYRAGFLFGVAAGHAFEVSGRMGSVLGSCQVEVRGTQVLEVDLEDLRARYARAFGLGF